MCQTHPRVVYAGRRFGCCSGSSTPISCSTWKASSTRRETYGKLRPRNHRGSDDTVAAMPAGCSLTDRHCRTNPRTHGASPPPASCSIIMEFCGGGDLYQASSRASCICVLPERRMSWVFRPCSGSKSSAAGCFPKSRSSIGSFRHRWNEKNTIAIIFKRSSYGLQPADLFHAPLFLPRSCSRSITSTR